MKQKKADLKSQEDRAFYNSEREKLGGCFRVRWSVYDRELSTFVRGEVAG